ncbi:MAG: c-type cytochrome [Candidatus Binataceae bacterium]
MLHRVLLLPALLVALIVAGAPSRACADNVAEGRALFLHYCSSCHGTAGNGRGPVSVTLKEQPADLTQLGLRYGTPLPAGQIARIIDGRDTLAAHGDREMPVWGQRFSDIYDAKGSLKGDMDARIRKIIDYLNSIQAPPAPGSTPRAPMGTCDGDRAP